jgi:hypothetical protein
MLQTTLEASGTEWSALRNHIIPCMAHIMQVALGAFMSSVRVTGHTTLWEDYECYQQFVKDESIDIQNSHRL